MRATFNYTRMKKAMREIQPRIFRVGSGWGLGYRLVRLNSFVFLVELVLASVSAVLFYAPALFLQKLVEYLEIDRNRENAGWGWVYAVGLFSANAVGFLGAYYSPSRP